MSETPRFEIYCPPVVARDSTAGETSWRYEAGEPEYLIDNERVSADEFRRRWNERDLSPSPITHRSSVVGSANE